MKAKLITLVIAIVMLISFVSPVFAGGGKNRGEVGQGSVHQQQVQDPPPFSGG